MIVSDGATAEGAFAAVTNAALLVIDMQNDGMDMIPAGRAIVPAVRLVLEACRTHGLPVVFKLRVQRPDGIDVERFRLGLFAKRPFLVEGTPGAAVVPELQPRAGEHIVRGARFSGFFQTDLQLILTRLGVTTLVVCGMQTPNCVRATVTDAIAYDYRAVVVEDAVAAPTPEIHAANLLDMRNMGVDVVPARVVLAALGDESAGQRRQ